MKELDFNVTIEEANILLQALGERPYAQVHGLIGKLQGQANQQIKSEREQGSEGSDTDYSTVLGS